MKIGVVTFWTSKDNYGQILQCWSLFEILKRKGHEPYLIRYVFRKKKSIGRKLLKFVLVYPCILKLKERIWQYINHQTVSEICKKNRVRKFDDFKSVWIPFSDTIYKNIDELRKTPPNADCYLTGSDQGWAQLVNEDNNKIYFLDFGDSSIKRVSYAPSFSMDHYPSTLKPKLRQLLLRYNAISVREKSGVSICSEIGIPAKHVLDPTMLLSKNDYIKMLNLCNNCNNFVYVYSLNFRNPRELRWMELKENAEHNQWEIIVTTGSGVFPGYEIYDKGTYYDYCTIDKWIENIWNANLVVTSSFHGVVFSIIMETPFVYIPLKGKIQTGNGRIIELLNSLGLNDRILTDNCSYGELIKGNINWLVVRNIVEKRRKESLLFIEENL